ncbi:hypothetical protein GCM10027570_01700 [Streptomonospora sediminis]
MFALDSFFYNPFFLLAIQFPMVIVGVLALTLAGRAPGKRGLIRTAGVLLVLYWLGSASFAVMVTVAPAAGTSVLGTAINAGMVLCFCGALILFLIALAFGGRGAVGPGEAAPQPAGGPAWGPNGPGGPQAGPVLGQPGPPGWAGQPPAAPPRPEGPRS